MASKENKKEYIIWIDVETSGDNPDIHDLLEVAACMTDMSGNMIGSEFESLVFVPHLSEVMSKAEKQVLNMHEKSGLWIDLWNSANLKTRQEVDSALFEWIKSKEIQGNLLFGGNSITLDRNFVRVNLPLTHSLISHQSVDVTSISKALSEWIPCRPYAASEHRALPDIRRSINDYKWIKSTLHAKMA